MVLAALGAIGSCESITGPGNGRIAIDAVIGVTMVAGDSARYFFSVDAHEQYAVYVQVQRGSVLGQLVDSMRGAITPPFLATASARPLDESEVLHFSPPSAGVYGIAMAPYPADSAAQFQFQVLHVNTAPESRDARINVGDSIIGETLEPAADVDVFTIEGHANEVLEVVLQVPGSPGPASVALAISDSTGLTANGFAYATQGTLGSTGRVTLPHDGTYSFRVFSDGSYHGPYQFWSYLIDRAPEHTSATLPLGTEVRGESIDRPGDVDEFTFTASAGSEWNAFVQASHNFLLEVAPSSVGALAYANAVPADTNLFDVGTGRFQIAQAGTYLVRISGQSPASFTDTGSYRFFLYPIDRRPEHVAAAITPGDTIVGEQVDHPGDIDEFTFTASAGQQFDAFLQTTNGSRDTYLALDAVDADGAVSGSAVSVGTDTSLLGQATGRYTVRVTGTQRLRVRGVDTGARTFGPFRLFLYAVNPKPETVPDTLAFGDSVLTERIDVPGDVDEYRVHVRDSSAMNLLIQLPDTNYTSSLTAQMLDSVTGQVVTSAATLYTGFGSGGTLVIKPGSYIVRVQGTRGRYRLFLYRFRLGPEVAHDTIAIGDTISTESIDPYGDVDAYHFHGVARQHVNLLLQGTSPSATGYLQAFVTDARGFAVSLVISPTSSAALTDHQAVRFELPGTGWYTLTLSGGSSPAYGDRGPYRVALVPTDTAPEHVAATLTLGDSVTTELIDAIGDWDQYTVNGAPGTELGLILGSNLPDCCTAHFPVALAFDPVTGDTLARAAGVSAQFGGPFHMPAGGSIQVAVFESPNNAFRMCTDATCNGIYGYTGPYRLYVFAINRAPEFVPATFAVGDTVRGETITPGDYDEFTSTATPGDTLRPYFRLTANPSPAGQGLVFEIVDPATGADISTPVEIQAAGSFSSPGTFVVPASGHFMLRVRGNGFYPIYVAAAPYEFFVRQGP